MGKEPKIYMICLHIIYSLVDDSKMQNAPA